MVALDTAVCYGQQDTAVCHRQQAGRVLLLSLYTLNVVLCVHVRYQNLYGHAS